MALCDEDRIEAAIMSGPRAWAAADGPHSGVLAHSSTDDDQRAAAAVVAFDLAYDAANPLNWRAGKKWVVTDVLFATGFNRIMVSARAARHCVRAPHGAGRGCSKHVGVASRARRSAHRGALPRGVWRASTI